MIDLLIILLAPALKFLNEPKKFWYFFWAPLPAWFADIIITHSTWVLVAGFPHIGEVTISDTLERLCSDLEHPDHALFWQLGLKINRVAGYVHIRALKSGN
jgi:hypothetical protein